MKTYSELLGYSSFADRFNYLKLDGEIGHYTFGGHRYLNQNFYQRSKEWKQTRNRIIVRDDGCDLGVPGELIFGKIIVHHINPIRLEDFFTCKELGEHDTKFLLTSVDYRNALFDEENLISVSMDTHNRLHYGSEPITRSVVERTKNDTCPWRH